MIRTPRPRARAVEERAARYRYDRDHMGALFVCEVPREERYDAAYAAAAAAEVARLMEMRATQSTRSWPPRSGDADDASPASKVDALFQHLAATAQHFPQVRPTVMVGYDDLVGTAAPPQSMGRADDDAYFAWQRLAGPSPILLKGVDALPENVPLDAATFARARPDGDRLDVALDEGRIFVCDYGLFEGMETGATNGEKKSLWAPVAVFVRTPKGPLMPVAIQVGQRPGPDNPLWTPADGVAWRMAKTAAQSADANLNGVVAHFGLCHLMAEALVCVSHRQLSWSHPLMHLLRPHFAYTLAVNATARASLVNPGGQQEVLLAGALSSNFRVVNKSLADVRYDAAGARADFAARRLDDPSRLPMHPLRDDGVPIADAIDRWVDAYLRAYYADDAAVRADAELAAWAAELGGPGGFHAMPALTGVASLVRFVADLLWRLTGLHAVVNYGGWDHIAWAPGMPSSAYGPGPRAGATEDDWRAMLPPLSVAQGMLETMHKLANIRLNRLGEYPAGHFTDPRVAKALEGFQSALRSIEVDTAARDAARPWSFPFLHPSRVPTSIHV